MKFLYLKQIYLNLINLNKSDSDSTDITNISAIEDTTINLDSTLDILDIILVVNYILNTIQDEFDDDNQKLDSQIVDSNKINSELVCAK